MTPTEQDKLREQVHKLFGDYQADDGKLIDMTNEVCAVADFITTDRKRAALEARIEENTRHLNRYTEAKIQPYAGSMADWLSQRIAELKAQQEEV